MQYWFRKQNAPSNLARNLKHNSQLLVCKFPSLSSNSYLLCLWSGKTEFQKKVKDHVDIQPNASASAKLDNYLHPDKQSSREKLSTFTEPNVVPTYVPLKDALAVLDIVPQSFGDEAREYVYSSSPIGGKENVESALFNKIPKTLFFYLGKDMEKDHMREHLPMTRRHGAHNKWLKNSASSMPLSMAIYSKSIGIV